MPKLRILVALATLAALLSLAPSAQAANYTLEPVTPTIQAGERLDFIGTGFIKGERVASWATSPDQRVYGGEFAAARGDSGRIEVGFDVPGNAVNGRWSLTVYGEYSKEPVVTTFEVVGGTTSSGRPAISVSPPAGPAGTRFSFYADGFDELEDVSYWFTAPDNTIIAFPEGVEAKKGGDVYFDWVAPATAKPGRWVVTVQGPKSNTVRGIAFEIQ